MHMVLHWDDERHHNLDGILTVVLVGSIVAFMLAWYFEVLPYNTLILTMLPVGLSHWYQRKLRKLFKTYGGASVTVGSNKLVLSKPDQDFEVAIKFRDIQSVKPGRWLLLNKVKLTLKDGREVELVNLLNQDEILKKINP